MSKIRYEFPYTNEHKKGIFNFLRNNALFPILDSIIATNSSILSSYFNCLYPFGIDNDDFSKSWESDSNINSWLAVEFKRFRVRIDSYSTMWWATDYPVSWVLEGTNNNGRKWDNVSYIYGRTSLPSDRMFHCETTNRNYYSKFRITMLGTRRNNEVYNFELFLLEFFGGMQIGNKSECAKKIYRSFQSNVFILVFMTIS